MGKTKNKNTQNIVKSLLPYLLIGIIAYSPLILILYLTEFNLPYVLRYAGGFEGLLFSTILFALVCVFLLLLKIKGKFNIYFLGSILLNVSLITLLIFYFTSPFLDDLIINKSLLRLCQTADPSFNKQCNKLLENWKLPLPLAGSEINDWKNESEALDYIGKINYKIPPNAEFEKSSHSGHPNFGTLKGLPTFSGFPICINLSLFSDSGSLDEAIDQGATRWGDSAFLNYEVKNEFSDNNIKERIIKRDNKTYLDAVVLLGDDLRDTSRKIYLYADECNFSDSEIFRTFIRNISK